MLAFIIRRLGQAMLVMTVVGLIAFTLFRFVGDPVNQMVGIETSAEERAQLRQELGLNDPVIIQFAHFAWRAVHFNFGVSLYWSLVANAATYAFLGLIVEMSPRRAAM